MKTGRPKAISSSLAIWPSLADIWPQPLSNLLSSVKGIPLLTFVSNDPQTLRLDRRDEVATGITTKLPSSKPEEFFVLDDDGGMKFSGVVEIFLFILMMYVLFLFFFMG